MVTVFTDHLIICSIQFSDCLVSILSSDCCNICYPVQQQLVVGLKQCRIFFNKENTLKTSFVLAHHELYTLYIRCLINSLVPNAPFLYPLKISENLTVFSCFQGVEKGWIGNKRVKVDTGNCNCSPSLLNVANRNVCVYVGQRFKNGPSKICGRHPLKNLK